MHAVPCVGDLTFILSGFTFLSSKLRVIWTGTNIVHLLCIEKTAWTPRDIFYLCLWQSSLSGPQLWVYSKSHLQYSRSWDTNMWIWHAKANVPTPSLCPFFFCHMVTVSLSYLGCCWYIVSQGEKGTLVSSWKYSQRSLIGMEGVKFLHSAHFDTPRAEKSSKLVQVYLACPDSLHNSEFRVVPDICPVLRADGSFFSVTKLIRGFKDRSWYWLLSI